MAINWELAFAGVSVLWAIAMTISNLLRKYQDQKDKTQDNAVKDLKERIEKLEGQIDTKLDVIVSSLSELKTSMSVSSRDTKEAFDRITINFQKIESISNEISQLKERLGILESKQV